MIIEIRRGAKGHKMLTIDGLLCAQSPQVQGMLNSLFKQRFELIIEIGTMQGGFTRMLQKKWPHIPLHTFDINPVPIKNIRKKRTFFHQGDVFKHPMLPLLLKDARKKLVLCDGGDKIREVNTFSPMINPRDWIGAHDFSKLDYWPSCEITRDAVDETHLKFEGINAAWGWYSKKID